jgi:phage terminase small subunit
MPRHKKSIDEHIENGTYRHSRHLAVADVDGLEVLTKVPALPESLAGCDMAADIWRNTLPHLVKAKRIAPEDIASLAHSLKVCKTIEVLDAAIDSAITEANYENLIKFSDGRNRQMKVLLDLLGDYGVTSQSRQRLMPLFRALNKPDDNPLSDLNGEDDA